MRKAGFRCRIISPLKKKEVHLVYIFSAFLHMIHGLYGSPTWISGISKLSFILLASRSLSEMVSLSRSTLPTISITRCRVGLHNSISMQYFLGALKKPRQTNAYVNSTTSSSSLKTTTQGYIHISQQLAQPSTFKSHRNRSFS